MIEKMIVKKWLMRKAVQASVLDFFEALVFSVLEAGEAAGYTPQKPLCERAV